MLKTDCKQYHIPAEAGEIGRYCILPGDPDRCEQIAKYLDHPKKLGQRREYTIWNGYLSGELVTVCSTGIGGPSTAIAVEELANCGADTMIRIGTCGGIAFEVKSGDIVIASGAVRQEGTSHEYAPPAYPATPSPEVLLALIETAREKGLSWHAGVVQSKDSFYGQHAPENKPTSADLIEKWEAWKKLGVLASEMEASTLFVVGAYRRLRTGAVFLTVWNQERYLMQIDGNDEETHNTTPAIKVAIGAIQRLIEQDRRAHRPEKTNL